jgi:hypothetical protein
MNAPLPSTSVEEQDFQSALRRARLALPADRYAVMFEAYLDFQAVMRCLDDPLPYGDEPAVAVRLLPGGTP